MTQEIIRDEHGNAVLANNPHYFVATVRNPTPSTVADAQGEIVEIRLDTVWNEPPTADEATELLVGIREATTKPLIATLRPVRQQGEYDGPEDVRIGLLIAAAQAGFDFVDFENDQQKMGHLIKLLRDAGAKIILSNHLNSLPDQGTASRHLIAMQDQGGLSQKLAFPCETFPAFLRAVELTFGSVHHAGTPAIAPLFATPGQRAALAALGNRYTYGSSDAPVSGQPALSEITAAIDFWRLGDSLDQAPMRWLAVIGNPVMHSHSPAMFNAANQYVGRPENYVPLEIPNGPGMLRLFASVAARLGCRGFNVTTPFKQEIVGLVEPDDVATAIGAVNTVKIDGEKLYGTNTDGPAIQALLQRHCQAAKKIALIGTGGAARAAAWACQQLKFETTIFGRSEEKATALAADFGHQAGTWKNDVGQFDLAIDCTPGSSWMPEAGSSAVIGYAPNSPAFDNAPFTALELLHEQAVLAYNYWYDDEAPREIMFKALPNP